VLQLARAGDVVWDVCFAGCTQDGGVSTARKVVNLFKGSVTVSKPWMILLEF
jgi:hypothetical protein